MNRKRLSILSGLTAPLNPHPDRRLLTANGTVDVEDLLRLLVICLFGVCHNFEIPHCP